MDRMSEGVSEEGGGKGLAGNQKIFCQKTLPKTFCHKAKTNGKLGRGKNGRTRHALFDGRTTRDEERARTSAVVGLVRVVGLVIARSSESGVLDAKGGVVVVSRRDAQHATQNNQRGGGEERKRGGSRATTSTAGARGASGRLGRHDDDCCRRSVWACCCESDVGCVNDAGHEYAIEVASDARCCVQRKWECLVR